MDAGVVIIQGGDGLSYNADDLLIKNSCGDHHKIYLANNYYALTLRSCIANFLETALKNSEIVKVLSLFSSLQSM